MSEEILVYKGQNIHAAWFRKTYSQLMLEANGKVDQEALENTVQMQIDRRKCEIDRRERRHINNGFRLTFYVKERKLFPTEFTMKVDDEKTRMIIAKITRHFKFKVLTVRFWGKRNNGRAWTYEICLSHNPAVAVICHELAHSHNQQKYANMHHNKKLLRTMTRFIEFCRRKGFV